MTSVIAILIIYRLLTQNVATITSILILFQMVLFYHFNFLSDGALIPIYVLEYQQYYRVISSIFLHVDQIHLYFNMISLISRGNSIEQIRGIIYYMKLIVGLAISSNLIYISIVYCLHLADISNLYYIPVAGFSGVLFGLKMIYDLDFAPEYQVIFGQRIMTKYIVYIELLVVSILHPNVSFFGHLCGIFAAITLRKIKFI